MYRALYRKWRPAAFRDVVGQQAITTALKNQLLHDKVAHAYLFTGTRGTGKTTCAKIFAKAVNCPNRTDADPCNECAVCRGIDDGSVLDVVEIDAASNNGVDNIRDLREETVYTPSEGKYKVYIIDEVHMLSTAAFNALLKTMEEPPPHVIFILATTEIHKVPATILSRCQRYDFKRIAVEDIQARLLEVAGHEKIQLDEPAAGLIARLADGAMRDALSILDTCAGVSEQVDEALVRKMAGVTDRSYLFELSDALARQDAPAVLTQIASLRQASVDMKRLCDELIVHYRNLMLAAVPGAQNLLNGVSREEQEEYERHAQNISAAQAVQCIKTLCAALDKMGKGVDARIELELAVYELCYPTPVVQAAPAAAASTAHGGATVFAAAFAAAPPSSQAFVSAPAPTATTPQKAPVAAPQTTPEHSAANQGQETPFEPWAKVLEVMQGKDKLLSAALKDSRAYYDGKRVLIDGSELFLEYMRKNEFSSEMVKSVLQQVTGVRYPIGPYKKKRGQETENQPMTADATLEQLSSAGVDVVYINETEGE